MDTDMPKLKQPMTLEEICIRMHINRYCGACEKWMQDLLEAMARDKDAYQVVIKTVYNESRGMEGEISKLPPGILKLLSLRLAKKFDKLIRTYGYPAYSLRNRSKEEVTQINLCKTVCCSILSRYTAILKIKLNLP
jgi:hypothetical protein